MCEIWKDIPDYNGMYQVSNQGNIRAVKLNKDGSKLYKIRKLSTDKDGYFKICLYKDGFSKTFRVHRLVALVFIDNSEGLPMINHKDENKQNNCVENLEWCTAKYNTNYNQETLARIIKIGAEASAKKVAQYDVYGNFIQIYNSALEASKALNLKSSSGISNCCNGKSKKAGGFIWKFA